MDSSKVQGTPMNHEVTVYCFLTLPPNVRRRLRWRRSPLHSTINYCRSSRSRRLRPVKAPGGYSRSVEVSAEETPRAHATEKKKKKKVIQVETRNPYPGLCRPADERRTIEFRTQIWGLYSILQLVVQSRRSAPSIISELN